MTLPACKNHQNQSALTLMRLILSSSQPLPHEASALLYSALLVSQFFFTDLPSSRTSHWCRGFLLPLCPIGLGSAHLTTSSLSREAVHPPPSCHFFDSLRNRREAEPVWGGSEVWARETEARERRSPHRRGAERDSS